MIEVNGWRCKCNRETFHEMHHCNQNFFHLIRHEENGVWKMCCGLMQVGQRTKSFVMWTMWYVLIKLV